MTGGWRSESLSPFLGSQGPLGPCAPLGMGLYLFRARRELLSCLPLLPLCLNPLLRLCALRCCVASQQRDRSHSAIGQTGATPFSNPSLASEE